MHVYVSYWWPDANSPSTHANVRKNRYKVEMSQRLQLVGFVSRFYLRDKKDVKRGKGWYVGHFTGQG